MVGCPVLQSERPTIFTLSSRIPPYAFALLATNAGERSAIEANGSKLTARSSQLSYRTISFFR